MKNTPPSIRVAMAAAALVSLSFVTDAQAQTPPQATPTPTPQATPAPTPAPQADSDSRPWKGLHLGVAMGAAILSDGSNNTIVFDKNLDGTFDDTVLTSGGANAFSPGFCSGGSATTVPTGGCSQETKQVEYGARAGYDWRKGRWVLGALAELTMPNISDSVTAFSTTPAYYTFTRDVDWLFTAGLRVGLAGDRWLVYVNGAPAYAKLAQRFATSNIANTFVRNAEDSAWGWQFGGGIDIRVTSRVTLGAVYTYTRFKDADTFTVRAQGPVPATNPFILTNANGTDMRRADDLKWHSVRGVLGIRF
jgi:outer membrane immunogenic protein